MKKINKTSKTNEEVCPKDKKRYYKAVLKYKDPNDNEVKNGCVFASFEEGDNPHRVWAYFKITNAGTITWAIREITKEEFLKGPYTYENAIAIRLNKYFREIKKEF